MSFIKKAVPTAVAKLDRSVKGTVHSITYLDALSAEDLEALINNPEASDVLRPGADGVRPTDRHIHRTEGHLAIVCDNGFVTHAGECILAGTYDIVDEDGELAIDTFWSSLKQVAIFTESYPDILKWVSEAICPENQNEIDAETEEYSTAYLTVTVDIPSSTILDVSMTSDAPKRDLTLAELRAKIVRMMPAPHRDILDVYDELTKKEAL